MNIETMLETVKAALAEETPAPNLQATVLLTDHCNLHVAVCRDVLGWIGFVSMADPCLADCGYDNLLTMLKTKGETRILKIVTMWKNGGIDSPSMKFNKSIYEMNKENLETEVFFGKKYDDAEELPPIPIYRKLKHMIY